MKKLVRDKIPGIMIAQGKSPQTIVLDNETDYTRALEQKLVEEVHELLQAADNNQITEELADVYEVLEAFCALKKIDQGDVANKKTQKKKVRGGFAKRIMLVMPK